MAKANGRFSIKAVGDWFSTLAFDEQQKILGALQDLHGKVRQGKIDMLKRELAALENGSSNGHAAAPPQRAPKTGAVKIKYRDPKSGETWSGRGRMARWLVDKIDAGEKQDKYLA